MNLDHLIHEPIAMMFADLVDQIDFLEGLAERGLAVNADTPLIDAVRILDQTRSEMSDEQRAQFEAYFEYLKSDQVTLHPDVADVLP